MPAPLFDCEYYSQWLASWISWITVALAVPSPPARSHLDSPVFALGDPDATFGLRECARLNEQVLPSFVVPMAPHHPVQASTSAASSPRPRPASSVFASMTNELRVSSFTPPPSRSVPSRPLPASLLDKRMSVGHSFVDPIRPSLHNSNR
ncbi:hypothetical protein BDZ97DRAFT_1922102 [Flammula alnicola]|nr:hypothetical protein BDZ97DRAFT_1922102 [Flammula alnicola]